MEDWLTLKQWVFLLCLLLGAKLYLQIITLKRITRVKNEVGAIVALMKIVADNSKKLDNSRDPGL